MLRFVIVAAVAVCWAAIEGASFHEMVARQNVNVTFGNGTGHVNHTHQAIIDSIKFHYDPHSQVLVMTQGNNCYALYLDHSQQIEIHSPSGLSRLELHLIQLVAAGGNHLIQMTSHELIQLTGFCGHHAATHFYHVSQTL